MGYGAFTVVWPIDESLYFKTTYLPLVAHKRWSASPPDMGVSTPRTPRPCYDRRPAGHVGGEVHYTHEAEERNKNKFFNSLLIIWIKLIVLNRTKFIYKHSLLSSVQPHQGWSRCSLSSGFPSVLRTVGCLGVDRVRVHLHCGNPLGGIKQMLDSQAFGLAFLFLLFSKNASASVRSPDDLCASYGVVRIYGFLKPFIPVHRTWWRCSAVIRVEIESHCAGTAEPAILAEPTLGLWRWSGAVVQDNCETDARTQYRIHTYTANIEGWEPLSGSPPTD